jgi:hypothetical protein
VLDDLVGQLTGGRGVTQDDATNLQQIRCLCGGVPILPQQLVQRVVQSSFHLDSFPVHAFGRSMRGNGVISARSIERS